MSRSIQLPGVIFSVFILLFFSTSSYFRPWVWANVELEADRRSIAAIRIEKFTCKMLKFECVSPISWLITQSTLMTVCRQAIVATVTNSVLFFFQITLVVSFMMQSNRLRCGVKENWMWTEKSRSLFQQRKIDMRKEIMREKQNMKMKRNHSDDSVAIYSFFFASPFFRQIWQCEMWSTDRAIYFFCFKCN